MLLENAYDARATQMPAMTQRHAKIEDMHTHRHTHIQTHIQTHTRTHTWAQQLAGGFAKREEHVLGYEAHPLGDHGDEPVVAALEGGQGRLGPLFVGGAVDGNMGGYDQLACKEIEEKALA